MKFATGWWGVQILAETDEDNILLGKLLATLPEEAEHSYEAGVVAKMDPADADSTFGFDSDEVLKSKLVIEFLR